MSAIIGMIAEGMICKDCGAFIDGETPGYERNCGCIAHEKGYEIFKNDILKNIVKAND